jgi:hypothetical protein
MAAPVVSKPPAGNRKSFRRTSVPRIERLASVVIVILLAGIGAAIWIKGRHFDPNRFALRPDALKSTAAAIEGKTGTLRPAGSVQPGEEETSRTQPTAEVSPATEGNGADATEGHPSVRPSAAVKGDPLELAIPGLQAMSATEFYSADNLFEKIDGRAPAYLGFNFQRLRCRSFSVAGGAGSFVDVFEYRFDTPINAFGIFSLERDPKGQALAFAPDGYSGELGYFFRQGACYVQVIASDQNAKTIALAKAAAENRAKNLPADDAGLDARRRLPATGLDPASVSFVQENALGQAFLKNVFQAKYDFAGNKLPFFLMVTTPSDAAAAWQSYLDFCGKYGGKATVLPDSNGARLFQAESFGTFKVIYQKAGEIGGVFDADDAAKARQFAEKYLAGELK